MRFYLKLSFFVLAFIGMHQFSRAHQGEVRMAVFTLRCGLAFHANDEQGIEQLVLEAQQAYWQNRD